MRGEERRQRAMLVVIDPEQLVPKGHPLRRIKELADATLVQLSPTLDAMYSAVGPAVDSARAALEGLAADGAVHRQKRAAVLRAARLQLLVSLVPRPGSGRAELRPLDLFAQPPTAVGARPGARVLRRRGRAGRRPALALG